MATLTLNRRPTGPLAGWRRVIPRRVLDHDGAQGHRRRRLDWKFPNAGKSTLLFAHLSRLIPRSRIIPFTTKYPNLGTVVASEHQFVMADIPGLIGGAHAGHGLGHEFLRHVEHSTVLVHLVGQCPWTALTRSRTIERFVTSLPSTVQQWPSGPSSNFVITKMDMTGGERIPRADHGRTLP